MSKKLLLFMLVTILLGVVLSACERPASTAPSTTPTGGDIPFPVQQPTTGVGVLASQTAAAKIPVITTTAVPGAKPTTPAQPTAQVPAGVATKPPVQAQPTTQPPAQPPAATAAPVVVIPSATPGRPSNYTIQSGDHFICLARRYNLNLSEFLSDNGLSMNSQAVVGTSVKIPQGGSWNTANGSRTLKPHPDTYAVQSGDTIYRIACTYGDVDPNNIILANSLSAPYSVSAGQSLKIP